MEINSSFGYWIRRRRKALDLTQSDLARSVVCTLSTIKKIELDERRPSILMAERLADCLQIPPVERENFIKVARQVYSPDRLEVKDGPIASGPSANKHTNLPIPASRLIGRTRQITELTHCLQNPDVRLLTLTGTGGVGKTRLACTIADRLLPEYRDGAWMVELAPISNPGLVAQQVISTFGIQQANGKSPLVSLASYLQQKHILLLLDNCEHLLDECAQLAHALLSSCSHLVILCTSREALNTPEEFIWLVPPLDLPDSQSPLSLDDISQIESINLFVDRARHVLPSFRLTEQNISPVVNICRRLDGLPLAIELAAARIRTLSPDQICDKLDNAIQFLESGFRTADLRQQTMAAAIEWSFSSLSLPERILLRRLSVFASGWTLSAAESICSTSVVVNKDDPHPFIHSLDRGDVLNLLIKLVNKSMVVSIDGHRQEQRFALLETIRQYAHGKLVEAGEMKLVRQSHLEYYMNWVELISPELRRPEQVSWLKVLDLELENLRLALTWGLELAPQNGLRLGTALYRYWRVRNMVVEGENWLEKLLDQPECQLETVFRARALGVLSTLGIFSAPAPEEWASESLAISETVQDQPARAFALWILGTIYYLRYEKLDQGRTYLEASLQAYRSVGDSWGMAQVLYQLANLVIFQGDAVLQRNYLEQSLALYRESGDLRGLAGALDNLASIVADTEADLITAQRLVEEALELYQQLEAGESKHNALYVYANILGWRGEYQSAREILHERLEIVKQSRVPLDIVLAELLLAYLDRLAGREGQASFVLEECIRTMKASDPRLVQSRHLAGALRELAYILARRGNLERAAGLIEEAMKVCEMPGVRADIFQCRGTLYLLEKKGEAALADFLQSLDLCQSGCFKLNAILSVEGIAGALSLLSASDTAARFMGAAAAFRDRIGAPVSPWDQPVVLELKEKLNESLGAEAFNQAWKVGRSLIFDRVIDEALAIRVDRL